MSDESPYKIKVEIKFYPEHGMSIDGEKIDLIKYLRSLPRIYAVKHFK